MTKQSTVWPNFFIVGAAKAGTTSLYEWLRQHPDIYFPSIKEPHFFSNDLVHRASMPKFMVKDQQKYLDLFKSANGFKAIGEASASYLPFGDIISGRIHNVNPDARIIILLRDPIERAYSDYLMYVRQGKETLTFYDALTTGPHSNVYIQKYADSVASYLKIFGEQKVLILLFQDLKNHPRLLLKKVSRFLEIDELPMMDANLSIENQGGFPKGKTTHNALKIRKALPIRTLPVPKRFKSILRKILFINKPPIDPLAIEYLRPFFETDLNQLEHLLNRPLPELRQVW